MLNAQSPKTRSRLIANGSRQSVRDDPLVQAVYFGSGKTFETTILLRLEAHQ
jgi:hypothetical protein